MSEHAYYIDDDLADASVDSWIDTTLGDVEDYLGRHAAFDAFLDADD